MSTSIPKIMILGIDVKANMISSPTCDDPIDFYTPTDCLIYGCLTLLFIDEISKLFQNLCASSFTFVIPSVLLMSPISSIPVK